MRIIVSGPSGWRAIEKRDPKGTKLAKEWLSVTVDALSLRGEVEAASSLQLGLDTYFASLCVSRGIPLTVFISCRDQDKFWNTDKQQTFHHLISQASNVIQLSSESYFRGCIQEQTQAVTNWLVEEKENSRLLIVKKKYRPFNSSQTQRKRAIPKPQILKFEI